MVGKIFEENELGQSPFAQMRLNRELLIRNLYQKIDAYEKKKLQEQVAYHKMSAFRKLLAPRTPTHHLAVEYLVYVKEPLEEIDKLNKEISLIAWMAERQEILPEFREEYIYYANKQDGKDEIGLWNWKH